MNGPLPLATSRALAGPVPLVALAGAAGTGKTTLGARLACLLGGTLLDLDDFTSPCSDRSRRYAVLTTAALGVLGDGRPVVAAAPWTQELQDVAWHDDLHRQAAERGGHLLVVWLHCDPHVLRARLTTRGLVRDRAKLADWRAWAPSLTRPPRIPHVAIDTTALTSGQPPEPRT